MKNTISTKTVKNLTGIEIMHYLLLWCYNWTEKDFRQAFKESPLGWNYFWDKLQEKINPKLENPQNPTSAVVSIILNMDAKHQQMLFDYIFDSRYADQINNQRELNAMFDEAIQKQNTNYPEGNSDHNIIE